jgi:hypothetical protein
VRAVVSGKPAFEIVNAFAAQWTMKRTFALRSGRRHIFTRDESCVLVPGALRDDRIRRSRDDARRVWNAHRAAAVSDRQRIRITLIA